jgi:Ig-like domain-containing protein
MKEIWVMKTFIVYNLDTRLPVAVGEAIDPGETAKFTVRATGTAPLRYQWRKNGVNITGATSASYTTPPTTAADNGSLFSVVVSNSGGSVTSNNATLTVRIPPTITTQPANKTVNVGQTAKFRVTATGTTPLHCQWMKNGVNITGATSASYTTPPTTAADNGSLFSVVVVTVPEV